MNDMAHALGDDRAAGLSPTNKSGSNSLPGSLRDRYTNGGQNTASSNVIRGDNVPTSRIVGFGTSPPVPVLQRGGGKSFKQRALSRLEQLKHKTQEALQARKERQSHHEGGQHTMSDSVQNTQMQRVIRRETVSEVVASATSAAELLFELRTCLADSGEVDASTHDMIAEMTHLCEERRARLAGLAGDEGLSETNLVLVLETIEKVNGALDGGSGGFSNATTATTSIEALGQDEDGVPLPPSNPLGVSPGNPFATPVSLSSPMATRTPPATRTVTRTDVPQTPEEEEAALAAAIAASLQLEKEQKQVTSSPSSQQQQQQQQQQVSNGNDIGNLIDF